MKPTTILAGAVALALAAGTVRADELKIGVATAQTGALAPYDQPTLAGLQLRLDELNAAGGLAGRYKAVLTIKDTRSDVAQTVQAAKELIDGGAQLLITPCDADPSIAAGQIAQAAKIPAITLCASTPTLVGAVGDYMFGSYPADNAQAAISAAYAIKQGYRTAYVLKSPDSAYTQKLPEYFGIVFTAKGGKVVGEGTYTMGQQSFAAQVTQIKAMSPPPDVIMTSAYEPDFPAFIKALRAAGVKIPVIGSDGIDTPTTMGLGDVVDGVVLTTAGYDTPGSALAAFDEKWKAKTGNAPDTVYYATGYDIGTVIDAALKAAGSTDPAKLRDAIAGIKDLPVVTGTITYAGTNGMPLHSIALVRIEKGKKELIEQGLPDAASVPAP